MRAWIPTHEITDNGRRIRVMEDDGDLYTQIEWITFEAADWSLDDGERTLRFQGGYPRGEVSIRRIIETVT